MAVVVVVQRAFRCRGTGFQAIGIVIALRQKSAIAIK
jgi:hypothetical protein